ncbi:hypothetical protein JOC34_001217 [Virgibacillus halotolerans]|nr:hypothetical protein [Virgibacillus halotolerans]
MMLLMAGKMSPYYVLKKSRTQKVAQFEMVD